MTAHRPSLRVGADQRLAAVPDGWFDWTIHRRDEPVAFLTTSLAGLGSGERLEAAVAVGADGRATVTTQGPTALLATDSPSCQRWHLCLSAGAHLTFLPWLALPHPASRSRSEVRVELDRGATLVAWEQLALGRVGRGELCVFAELEARFELVHAGATLLDDRLRLEGGRADEPLAALAGRTHLGTLYVAGLDEELLPLRDVREAVGDLELVAASRPVPELLVARALDRSGERLERGFWPLVALARARAGVGALAPADVARRWL